MHSCIYQGWVRHRRKVEREHEFLYRLFQVYLDLDEVPDLFRNSRLWSASRPALAWFRREDHLGDPQQPLSESVRDLVEAHTGRRPTGPVRLLTNLRYFGYVINPVSFYYCFGSDGVSLDAVVAEVNNTPWGERHCYVVEQPVDAVTGAVRSHWSHKELHVSPFMPMEMAYRWHLGLPGTRLNIHIENFRMPTVCPSDASSNPNDCERRNVFGVTMTLNRQEFTPASMRSVLIRYPFMTAKVAAAIYWQALRLKLKGVSFFPHPRRSMPDSFGNDPRVPEAALFE